ncbi:MAG: hypothetical protein Fur0020_11890 [Thermodesulfovibrionia bacterium]
MVTTVKPSEEALANDDTGKESPPLVDYSIITEGNLFHPERRFIVQKPEETLPRPDFALYGILIAGDVKVAYMEDLKSPYTTTGRGKRQRSVHLGETVSGYTLSEIYNDRVVMVRGDDRIEVRVMDLSKQKHQKTPTPKTPQRPQMAPDLRNRRPPQPSPRMTPEPPPQTEQEDTS